MFSRILLGVLAIFWAVMTALLWRSEYLGSNLTAIPIDPGSVWKRILTSPDSSSLAVVYQGERLGFCHVISSVGESLNQNTATNTPEGMVRNIAQYRLDFSGSINDMGGGSSVRFDGAMTFSQRQEWEEFQLQLISRPWFITVESTREADRLDLSVQGADFSTRRTFRLGDLNNPGVIVNELFNPFMPMGWGQLPFALPDSPTPVDEAKPQWLATTDRLVMGHSASQIYRLELKPAEGMDIVVLVSRAGEILRVDLPRGYKMVNEALPEL